MQFDAASRNNLIDEWVAFVGAAPKLRLISGTIPASCAASQTGTTLVSITLPSTWMNAASSGEATKAGTWQANSIATGTITHARLLNSAESAVRWQGTVSQAFALTTSASTAANGNVLTFTSAAGVTVGMDVYGSGVPAGTTVVAVTSTTVTLSQVSTAGIGSATEILFGDTSGDMFLAGTVIGSVGQQVTISAWTLVAPGA